MAFPCPACSSDRPGFGSSCPRCGWVYRERTSSPAQIVAAARPRGRRTLRAAMAGAALVLLVLAGIVYLWWQGRGIGAACDLDGDCNSHKCLKLFGGDPLLRTRLGVCTELCEQDPDCPDGMFCGDATRGNEWNHPLGDNRRRVCVPTGSRLRELLDR